MSLAIAIGICHWQLLLANVICNCNWQTPYANTNLPVTYVNGNCQWHVSKTIGNGKCQQQMLTAVNALNGGQFRKHSLTLMKRWARSWTWVLGKFQHLAQIAKCSHTLKNREWCLPWARKFLPTYKGSRLAPIGSEKGIPTNMTQGILFNLEKIVVTDSVNQSWGMWWFSRIRSSVK